LKIGRISAATGSDRRTAAPRDERSGERGSGVGMIEIEIDDAASVRDTLLVARERHPEASLLVVRSTRAPRDVAEIATELGLRSDEGGSGRGAPSIVVLHPDVPDVLDLRDLEAPEPLERILLAVSELAPGAVLVARTPRVPTMLLPHLERRGLDWACCREPDESGLVWIRRPA